MTVTEPSSEHSPTSMSTDREACVGLGLGLGCGCGCGETGWLRPQPAGGPETCFSARPCSGLPRASVSLGQSAAWAALAGHTGLAFRIAARPSAAPRATAPRSRRRPRLGSRRRQIAHGRRRKEDDANRAGEGEPDADNGTPVYLLAQEDRGQDRVHDDGDGAERRDDRLTAEAERGEVAHLAADHSSERQPEQRHRARLHAGGDLSVHAELLQRERTGDQCVASDCQAHADQEERA
eukprot:scaffold26353_cov68-Phaeocystis_antarctica.AAC.4